MPGVQRLLNNAREASAVTASSSSSNSSSSNSCTKDNVDGSPVSSISNTGSSCTTTGTADATSLSNANINSPDCADAISLSSANVDSPDSAQSQLPATSLALMSAVCSVEPAAALTEPAAPSCASPAPSKTPPANPSSTQNAAPDQPPSMQPSPSEAKRGGQASAVGYAPPWYALTRAANDATGQAGARSPGGNWILGSQHLLKLSIKGQHHCTRLLKYSTCTTFCRWFASWTFVLSGV